MSFIPPCWSPPRAATLLLLIFGVAVPAGAGPATTYRLYRCDMPDGKVELRQGPCPEGRQTVLSVEDRPVGWVAPAPASKTAKPKVQGPSPAALAAAEKAKAKQEENCWKAGRSLESVNRQLRRGYKPSAGQKLRDRREEYEAYLDRFCQ